MSNESEKACECVNETCGCEATGVCTCTGGCDCQGGCDCGGAGCSCGR